MAKKQKAKRPGRIKRVLGVLADQPIPSSRVGRLHELAKQGGSLGVAARLTLRFRRGDF